MGADSIPARSNGQTINETWFNLLRTVLNGDLIPRNASGVATAIAGALGSSTYPWFKLFLGAAASGLSIEEDTGKIIIKVGGTAVATFASTGLTRASLGPTGEIATSSSGAFSTASTSYTDVTNLATGSFVARGRLMMLALVSDGTAGNSRITVSSTTTATSISASLRFYDTVNSAEVADAQLGASSLGTASLVMNSYTPAGTVSGGATFTGTPATLTGNVALNAPLFTASYPSIPPHFFTPAAGTYNWKVQVKAGANSTILVNKMKLIAMEF